MPRVPDANTRKMKEHRWERLRLHIRRHFFSERTVRHCTAAQGGGAVSIPGGVQSRGDVALRDVGSGHGLDLVILVVFSSLYDSMTL